MQGRSHRNKQKPSVLALRPASTSRLPGLTCSRAIGITRPCPGRGTIVRRFTPCLMLAFAALCNGVAGCETSSAILRSTPTMEFHLNESAMKAEVLRFVSLGTPIDEAKKVMEANGFECCYDHDVLGDWLAGADPTKKGQVYLKCSKHRPQSIFLENLFTPEEVEVYFTRQDGKVYGSARPPHLHLSLTNSRVLLHRQASGHSPPLPSTRLISCVCGRGRASSSAPCRAPLPVR